LQAYQSILPNIEALGAGLIAVSPQLADGSLSAAEKNELQFEVLSDIGNAVARSYGIVWQFPKELQEVYLRMFGIVLPEHNGDDSWELPIPATFVIGQDSVIRYAFVDPDYTRRAEPADVLQALHAP
jgi:peroxiredoxin